MLTASAQYLATETAAAATDLMVNPLLKVTSCWHQARIDDLHMHNVYIATWTQSQNLLIAHAAHCCSAHRDHACNI